MFSVRSIEFRIKYGSSRTRRCRRGASTPSPFSVTQPSCREWVFLPHFGRWPT
jgi:hypothetical protein